ncbi:pectinesterase 3-like [Trifolium pratense]|uniref:pectinesterase 3-like n=1 Tax=Trifolium pratense TaxID=57577 RepID=UPI001E696A7D|nr:pectinesterase 3-like [Trifolium pratense]
MDTMKSFKGYGKVDEIEQQAFKKKTRKRITIIIISTVILLAVIIAAVAGILIHKRNTSSSSSSDSLPKTQLTPATSLKAVCEATQYPNSCFSAISSLPDSNTTDPEQLFKLSLKVAIDELSNLTRGFSDKIKASGDTRLKKAIEVCGSVLNDSLDRLNDSMSTIVSGEKILSPTKIRDVETWISAAITDHDTCLDAVGELNSTAAKNIRSEIETAMRNSTEFASNSLAIVTKVIRLLSNFEVSNHHRRLLGDFPEWLGAAERRLLAAEGNGTTVIPDTPDAVVAKDGSGQYKTIGEALKIVPKKSLKRFVVYVKKGEYVENIDLDKNTWNVMIYGDGMTETVVSGSRNFMDGTPTFETATFAVKGKGFIAKDIQFKNTAGASKHQAVALRSGSDESVFYRCSFVGFQDTLYAHSNRQFYRDCDITGTIDFIFGNAAVVFQNCKIMPRQPMANQFNTITAQGKKDPNQNTGIVIQKSTITTLPNDNLIAPTYLGRPWKDFSTTIIMKSQIGSFLKPVGWISWVFNVDPPSSILYAEYQNTGPGAAVDQRVKWAGYKSALEDGEALKFTVDSFIQGPEWLPNAAVQFDSTL